LAAAAATSTELLFIVSSLLRLIFLTFTAQDFGVNFALAADIAADVAAAAADGEADRPALDGLTTNPSH
jgi:hypothetical protein